MKTLAAMTPAGWSAPQQWQAPAQFPMQSRVLVYHAAPAAAVASSAMGCGNAIVGIVIALVMLGVTSAIVFATSPGLLTQFGIGGWDGTSPFSCGGNDTARIEDVTANLPNQTAITADQNCDLEIENSRITAWQGIRADGNRRIVIRNSTIIATGPGLVINGNREVELINSTVVAGEIGINAGGNVEVVVQGGRVQGARASTTSANATIDVRGGQMVDMIPTFTF
jgi:hypothetical protein